MTRTGSRKHANAFDSVNDSKTLSSLSNLRLSDNDDSTSSGDSSDVEDGEVIKSVNDLEEREGSGVKTCRSTKMWSRLMSEEEVTFDCASAKIPEYSVPTKTIT
ncbi:unnamed protein product [Cylicocyclus nassatus]|uniref:Uncharacterized protein n=1 Tax=Cylicocyclus nassatus TaxID=53992 RepID=A0AA36GNV7_CYLNA|nr:unnamed protein product [Cylicocyclus nassatus]